MNLADAIREAALKAAGPIVPAPEPETKGAQRRAKKTAGSAARSFDMDKDLALSGTENVTFDVVASDAVPAPASPQGQSGAGSVVRLELFLSPEQLSQLFRAFVGTQHSMMTLREAALYLRIHPKALEQMAKDGELPSIHLDGRWRFPKSSLDEWLLAQAQRSGGVSNVA